MLLQRAYQRYGTTILATVCGLTSLSTVGYIFVDSHHCFMKRQQSTYECRLKELERENLQLRNELRKHQF